MRENTLGAVNVPHGTSGRDDTGDSIVEHVAGVDDFEVAEAAYWAAVARWPAARPHLPASIQRLLPPSVSTSSLSLEPHFDGMCLSRHFRLTGFMEYRSGIIPLMRLQP